MSTTKVECPLYIYNMNTPLIIGSRKNKGTVFYVYKEKLGPREGSVIPNQSPPNLY